MAINLSFSGNDEDFTGRGAMNRHSAVTTVLAKALPEEFRSPHSHSSPLRYSPHRSNDGAVKRKESKKKHSKKLATSHVHQNGTCSEYNSPRNSSSKIFNRTASTGSNSLVRSKPVLKTKEYHNHILKNKLDPTQEYCSDSEISVAKVPIFDIFETDFENAFEANNENWAPSQRDIKQTCKDAVDSPNVSELGVNYSKHRKSSAPSSVYSYTDHQFPTGEKSRSLPRQSIPPPPQPISHQSPITSAFRPRQGKVASVSSKSSRNKSPSSSSAFKPVASNKKSTVSSNSLETRGICLSVSNPLPRGASITEVKRSKSLLNKSPTFRKRSPTIGRRKSPYKELEALKNCSDSEEDSSIISHLPPKSPANRHSSNSLDSSITIPSITRHKSLQTKLASNSNSSRKQRSSVSWKPVHEMMTNHQYEGHYHDDSSGEDGGHCEVDGGRVPRMKSFDAVVFDVLKVAPEEYARQLTILDFPIFCAINPDEITSCGWTKKNKWKISPNVCAMTQRFNHTSFWVIREILNASTLKIRAEILTHFIRIAKKLVELNNLHSLMAVIQSLNSSSIFRLTKTWAMVQKNHKASFDRLLSLVKEDDNRWELRSHMEGIKLPCIPFLGMYLSDVMYINSAHPDTGGLESHERTNKMNNILRVISEFQQSKYDHLQEQPHIKNYLNSVKYIEELQKFLEEDNYKLSLKIEPTQTSLLNTPDRKITRSKEELSTGKSKVENHLNRHYSQTPPSQQRFVPGHRKSRSLGKEFAFTNAVQMRPKSESSKIQKRRSMYGRYKQRGSTVWYISPTRLPPDNISYSGSLPRATVPSSNAAVTTSLLDDSIIATPSSLASSTSSTTRMSVTGGNGGSIGSSRSNSGSEFSEQDEMSWSSDRYRFRSLPFKKSRTSTKWFKVYHGNRGKYSLRAVSTKQEMMKSSTYPIEKKADFQSEYKSFVTSQGLIEEALESVESSSTLSDIDEFAKMRCQSEQNKIEEKKDDCDMTSNVCDVTHLEYDVDDEEASLIPTENVLLDITKKNRFGSNRKDATRSKGHVRDIQSSIAMLHINDGAAPRPQDMAHISQVREKYLMQYFVSPRLSVSQSLSSDDMSLSHTSVDNSNKHILQETRYGGYNPNTQSKDLPGKVEAWMSSASEDSSSRAPDISVEYQTCKFEGCLKRKCILKLGKKPAMSQWTKYWVCLCDTQLVYFGAKTLRGHDRHHFKSRPCKAVSIRGWMLLYSNDPSRLDCFQLNNPESGNMYRFQCDSKEVALVWISNLEEAIKGYPQPERDLINLEDS